MAHSDKDTASLSCRAGRPYDRTYTLCILVVTSMHCPIRTYISTRHHRTILASCIRSCCLSRVVTCHPKRPATRSIVCLGICVEPRQDGSSGLDEDATGLGRRGGGRRGMHGRGGCCVGVLKRIVDCVSFIRCEYRAAGRGASRGPSLACFQSLLRRV